MSRIINLFILLLALLTLISATQADPAYGQKYKANELICKLLPEYSIDSLNAVFGTSTKSHQTATDCYLLNTPSGQDAESLAVVISQYPGVLYCKPNYLLSTPEGLQRSSPFLDLQAVGDITIQPPVSTLSLPEAHEISTGSGASIALIDGGVDFDHPEFTRTPGILVPRWDYIDNDISPVDEAGGSSSGHGTFIAGLVKLVAPDADIYIYRVLDTAGLGDGYTIADAIIQAIQDSCQIISLSLGMVGIHDAVDDAIKLAKQHDITVVVSAGNDSTDLSAVFPFPASRPYCNTVAALDSQNVKADFSNYGLRVDLCAPGSWIYGPHLNSLYAWWDGTSFAVPFVAGIHALLAAEYPSLTSDQRDTLIFNTAMSVDSINPGLEGLLGFGLIDPVDALSSFRQALGDLSGDRFIDLTDLSMLIGCLVLPNATHPGPTADLDCSGVVDLTDLAILISYIVDATPISCP